MLKTRETRRINSVGAPTSMTCHMFMSAIACLLRCMGRAINSLIWASTQNTTDLEILEKKTCGIWPKAYEIPSKITCTHLDGVSQAHVGDRLPADHEVHAESPSTVLFGPRHKTLRKILEKKTY